MHMATCPERHATRTTPMQTPGHAVHAQVVQTRNAAPGAARVRVCVVNMKRDTPGPRRARRPPDHCVRIVRVTASMVPESPETESPAQNFHVPAAVMPLKSAKLTPGPLPGFGL